ncbi:hypothetical protein ACTA71_000401 [Dictyostelium dimigraforme]
MTLKNIILQKNNSFLILFNRWCEELKHNPYVQPFGGDLNNIYSTYNNYLFIINVVLYICLVSSLALGLVGFFNISDDIYKTWPETLEYLGFSFFGTIFFISIVMMYFSSVHVLLENFENDSIPVFTDHLRDIQQNSYELFCSCSCFHSEVEYRSNAKGERTPHTETVYTYNEEIKIPVTETIDVTEPLNMDEYNSMIGRSKYLHINFKIYSLPEENCKNYIQSVIYDLTLRNKSRDVGFSINVEYRPIKHLNRDILISLSPSKSPSFFLNTKFYWLSIFFLMHLPFELYFRSKYIHTQIDIVKIINCAPLSTETNSNQL